jgi:hypothetical protein
MIITTNYNYIATRLVTTILFLFFDTNEGISLQGRGIGYHNLYNGAKLPTTICVMVPVRLQGKKTSKITAPHM